MAKMNGANEITTLRKAIMAKSNMKIISERPWHGGSQRNGERNMKYGEMKENGNEENK